MSGLDFGRRPGIGDDADDDAVVGDAEPIVEDTRVTDPAAHATGEDELDRSLRPKTLDEFIGQRRLREQLRIFVDAAKQRDEALDHALFAGPPGLGKCVKPDTLLFTPYGMVPIAELGELGGESWQPIARQLATLYGVRTADYFYDNGESSTLRVTTGSGYRVEGTPNHPMLIRSGDGRMQFRRLSELRTGDQLAVRLGAQIFGSSTRLHVEGVHGPTLDDPATMPEELTPDLARLLGLLMHGGRQSPKGDGFVFSTPSSDCAQEVERLVLELFCLHLDSFGASPLGSRYGQRSPRVARLLAGLGMSADGFIRLPEPIYRAPRLIVAEFLRGVFWGTEDAPMCQSASRTVVAHLQLMLTNFGIESAILPSQQGFRLSVGAEPARYDSVDPRDVDMDIAHTHDDEPGAVRPPGPAAAAGYGAFAQAPVHSAPEEPPALEDPGDIGFGVTPAGVLVALGRGVSVEDGYRRGSSRSSDIAPASRGTVVSVAEVEPAERGRALTRELHISADDRALAVRSVTSELRPDEVVQLVWEPVASIEPGFAHTCDVSVPDGHTFVGNGLICHNTTLASVVASELGSNLQQTSGPALEKKADVAAILTSLGPRDVLFIDEIHRLSTAIEEVLYSAMEDYQIDIVLGQGPAARTIRLDLEPFTLVGATTRTGLLTTPLRDRFGMIHRLEYYDPEELQQIVLRSARLLGMEVSADAATEIAGRSRGTPRIANRLLKRVRDVAEVRYGGDVDLEVAREALDLVDVDAGGLDRVDRLILESILRRFDGGPVGLSTLSVAIGEEPHTLEDVYEPYLLQLGLIQRTPRGRIITERGRQHIGASRTEPMYGRGSALF